MGQIASLTINLIVIMTKLEKHSMSIILLVITQRVDSAMTGRVELTTYL